MKGRLGAMAEKKASKPAGKKATKKAAKDPKEQFRQALERKKDQQQGRQTAAEGGDPQGHGKPDTHSHSHKREFRRKSG